MSVFSRLGFALNQSFRLVFVSISNGIEFVFKAIQKTIRLVGTLIKKLHGLVTTVVQLALNVSSILFILFIPVIFLIDPLNWSWYFVNGQNDQVVLIARLVAGAFFSLVAYFLISGLIRSWKESAINPSDPLERDFILWISRLASWAIIFVFFAYFTVFRLDLFGYDLEVTDMQNWLRNLGSPDNFTSN